ncbi:DUF2314 domain-containing protein [Chitinolyticbacter meiyuanensis]|uniref:DUF2314 domain-containing protein n=1 Tax=Chitinolyticbacter meiyuanensis TaxID=682798 RepID=UPI00165287E0|nr:DUF2314 domain-containing protein [Chitinolyticbacter meiyuanensis]
MKKKCLESETVRLSSWLKVEPGARFSYVTTEDDDFQETIVAARSTLDYFRALIAERADDDAFPLVRVLLSEPQFQAYMWLLVISDEASGFTGEIFELPNDFEHHVVGQQLSIPDATIQDWMINDKGTLYGGYSLRYSRSKLNANEIAAFDEHVGVERYA